MRLNTGWVCSLFACCFAIYVITLSTLCTWTGSLKQTSKWTFYVIYLPCQLSWWSLNFLKIRLNSAEIRMSKLLKDCNNILLSVIWLDRKSCRWNCNGNTWSITLNSFFHRECGENSFMCFFIITTENLIWQFFYVSVHGDWQRNNIYLKQIKKFFFEGQSPTFRI